MQAPSDSHLPLTNGAVAGSNAIVDKISKVNNSDFGDDNNFKKLIQDKIQRLIRGAGAVALNQDVINGRIEDIEDDLMPSKIARTFNRQHISTFVDHCRDISLYIRLNSQILHMVDDKFFASTYMSLDCVTVMIFSSAPIAVSEPGAIGSQASDGSAGTLSPAANPPVGEGSVSFGNEGVGAATKANKDLVSDLVNYFEFYQNIFGDRADEIMLAPLDLSFMILVSICGFLGSVLRTVFEDIQNTGPDYQNLREQAVAYIRSFSIFSKKSLLSIMIALIFYIISRTTLISILDKTASNSESALNPYLVALLATSAGLLSNEAYSKIVQIGARMLSSKPNDSDEDEVLYLPGPKRSKSDGSDQNTAPQ